MYEASYPGPKSGAGRAENDPYIAIDASALAERLGCKPELLFGRLYYHLDQKYRYKQDDGALVPLFYLKVGEKRHAIHFPYLAAILAGLEQEHRKQAWSLAISILALVFSVVSIIVSFLKK